MTKKKILIKKEEINSVIPPQTLRKMPNSELKKSIKGFVRSILKRNGHKDKVNQKNFWETKCSDIGFSGLTYRIMISLRYKKIYGKELPLSMDIDYQDSITSLNDFVKRLYEYTNEVRKIA